MWTMSSEEKTTTRWDANAAACLETYRLCKSTSRYCQYESADAEIRACTVALDDCADIALLLANMFARRSPSVRDAAALSAATLRGVTGSFRRWEHHDPELRAAFAAAQNVIRICEEVEAGSEASARDERDVALQETFPASDAPPGASGPGGAT